MFALLALLTLGNPSVSSLSAPDYAAIAAYDATKYGINTERFLATIKCESRFKPNAVSKTRDFGIAQIHLVSHKVTKAQALDPIYSLDWAAKKFSEGHAKWWSCYRIITRHLDS